MADIGTGSGVIALSVAYEIPESRVVAVDISDEALMLAKENAHMLNLEDCITFVQGNMLDSLKDWKPFDAVISNPPYVKSGIIKNLQPEIRDFEPKIALDGGHDGLRFLSVIAESVVLTLCPPGPLERYTLIFKSFEFISMLISSASGMTTTEAAEV